MLDSTSEVKLAQVSPELAARVRQMASILEAQGIRIRVSSGLRSYAQQAALYANRASNPNPVAAPGTSKHERGLAVDLVAVSGGSSAAIGAAGESIGLVWGGRWNRPDLPHFELPADFASSSPPAGNSGLPVVDWLPSLSLPSLGLPSLGGSSWLALIFWLLVLREVARRL
jgi:peptidoglycan L-alanyl-D-glutamate endopeptidase CwlK